MKKTKRTGEFLSVEDEGMDPDIKRYLKEAEEQYLKARTRFLHTFGSWFSPEHAKKEEDKNER